EIQDASPSYISVRPPIIYDDKFRSGYPTAIIPDRANLEVSGTFRKKDVSVDYHLYMGNGLGNMQSSGPKNFTGNTNMAVGARLRLNYDENLKIGVSSYFDNAVIAGRFYGKTYNEKRVLLSVDADYTLWRFNVNGEYFFNSNKNDTLGKFNRTFFYVNLNFELMKKVRIYAEIDTYQDKIPDKNVASLLGNGINKAIAGINFKPNWVTAIKAEVQHFFFKGKFKPSRTTFTASFSVIF
ncbi:MAG: hypothetical protein GY950_16375, partial [bacterium]|nr:hypothetical protein [bacterium]